MSWQSDYFLQKSFTYSTTGLTGIGNKETTDPSIALQMHSAGEAKLQLELSIACSCHAWVCGAFLHGLWGARTLLVRQIICI